MATIEELLDAQAAIARQDNTTQEPLISSLARGLVANSGANNNVFIPLIDDVTGKLVPQVIPSIALTSIELVANQAARLALSSDVGDAAKQTDNGITYLLSALPASTNANWIPIGDTNIVSTEIADSGTAGRAVLVSETQSAARSAIGAGTGNGAINTASNLGAGVDGEGLFSAVVGDDLTFKRVKAGTGITLTPSANSVLIDASGGGGSPEMLETIGGALQGGDKTGDARGTGAMDVQESRTAADQVASGANAIAVGKNNKASSADTVCIGADNFAEAADAVAVGTDCIAGGAPSVAVGFNNSAEEADCIAIGTNNSTNGGSLKQIVVGASNSSSGANTTAIGFSNAALGSGATLVGFDNECSTDSTVVGKSNFGNVESVVIGRDCNAAQSGITIGISAITNTAGASIAIGNSVQTTSVETIVIGSNSSAANNAGSIAIGRQTSNSGDDSILIGNTAESVATKAVGIGFNALCRVQETTVINGPQIIVRDDGSPNFLNSAGVETVLMSGEFDLTTVGDVTITLPANCRFFPDEVDLIITSATGVTVQPTVRAGSTGDEAGLLAAVLTTGLTAAGHRQRFSTLLSAAGRTSLTGGTTVGATATTMLGRFAFRGLLVENE